MSTVSTKYRRFNYKFKKRYGLFEINQNNLMKITAV